MLLIVKCKVFQMCFNSFILKSILYIYEHLSYSHKLRADITYVNRFTVSLKMISVFPKDHISKIAFNFVEIFRSHS